MPLGASYTSASQGGRVNSSESASSLDGYSRRSFLGAVGLVGAGSIVGPHVVGRSEASQTSELLTSTMVVDVRDVGALGSPITTVGTVVSPTYLRIGATSAWKAGAGLGMRAVTAPTEGVTQLSFKCAVKAVRPHGLVPAAPFPRLLVGKRVMVANDDSIPIQAAIDSLRRRGGTVLIPAGLYVVGAPGYWNNQPIYIDSNVHIVGVGSTKSIVKVCDEFNFPAPLAPSNPREPADAALAASGKYRLSGGPVFSNRSNLNFDLSNNERDYAGPWYGRPHEDNIEIRGMGGQGNQNYQSVTFEPNFRPNPDVSVPGLTPTESLEANEVDPGDLNPPLPPGNLVGGSEYWVYARYLDSQGVEGPATQAVSQPITADGNAISVILPPIPPPNAVAVVIYVSSGSIGEFGQIVGEVDTYGDQVFERNLVVSPIPMWDLPVTPSEMPLDSSWPTVNVLNHTPYDPSNPTPESSNRLPGLQNYGEATNGAFADFFNVIGLTLTDLEASGFVVDGLCLQNVKDVRISNVSIHDNGRNGISLLQVFNKDVTITSCSIVNNGQAGLDMENEFACNDVRVTNCSFINNTSAAASVGIHQRPSPEGPQNPPDDEPVNNLWFTNCLFDGNFRQIFINAYDNGTLQPPGINDLRFTNCTFRNNWSDCFYVSSASSTTVIRGRITRCTFDQSNGRPRIFGPAFNSDVVPTGVPCIALLGAKIVFDIIGNTFTPFGATTGIPSPPSPSPVSFLCFCDQPMIDISQTSGGHTITDNLFIANPLDNRPEAMLLSSSPAQLPNNTYLEGLTRDFDDGYGYHDQGWKFQWFLLADDNPGPANEFPILSSCKISGNSGDGYILVNPNMPTDDSNLNICGLALEESGSDVALAEGSTTFSAYVGSADGFQAQLPGTWALPHADPPLAASGAYSVSCTFSDFDPGSWSITDQGPNGFAVVWANAAPAPTGTQQPRISWIAKFPTR